MVSFDYDYMRTNGLYGHCEPLNRYAQKLREWLADLEPDLSGHDDYALPPQA
ncbi:hypothetical protein [Pseudomonas sp.]|uniref:hypothetical protein n=1 Tax=Pseudomonas sp. TaxID=306 RepID=UPI002EDA50A5